MKMSKIFGKFYNILYNCLTPDNYFNFTQAKFINYFLVLDSQNYPPSDLASLNIAITAEELQNTIKDLPLHKSPGPDGLPYFYYKTFLDILSPHMLTLYGTLLKKETPHTFSFHTLRSQLFQNQVRVPQFQTIIGP